jgi:hypothetical protein
MIDSPDPDQYWGRTCIETPNHQLPEETWIMVALGVPQHAHHLTLAPKCMFSCPHRQTAKSATRMVNQ